MSEKLKIKNSWGENLDVLIEGKMDADISVVFVHGWGVDKDDGDRVFVDIAQSLKNDFRCVRFDLSGCGQSEGREEDANHQKFADDLKVVLKYVVSRFGPRIYLIAVSQGTTVATMAYSQLGEYFPEKTILLSPVDSNSSYGIERKKAKILKRGGSVDELGISYSPRSNGDVQKIGPGYWQTLRTMNPLKQMSDLACKTKLLVVRGTEDEFIAAESVAAYKTIANLDFIEITGNHTFKQPESRQKLIEIIQTSFTT